ncbi:Endonuclease/exonuclease/phosphatase family protein [Candidatus Rhodobacter oscarellae]|uniref:Endonuclease/exonuclease/phosphatase family protein n=1 Tax=Candidatus Rhodobacter oscarellae TaxID=1675527 RepID=A0A0J9E7S6_9RHOB|nr:endonuclease/exonuclease/phosphatase family protein [Candidatus Rhodobacter lobularis]KMW57814.1 Endonuclease/exonuclease/phosphatase family protein [Candidatus Rhodobacter lobularis]
MTDFTIASFNVKNLIGPDQEYYTFEKYTPEEHAWKEDWLAEQLLSLSADIVCFQEIFDEAPLQAVIDETDARGAELNDAVVPDRSKKYRKKAIFKKLKYESYGREGLAFARNANDGEPGHRRPGVATLSRFGFEGAPEVIQELEVPLEIPFQELGGADGGSYRISRLSRPILKTRIPVGGQVISVFNCHLKSKLGEFIKPERAPFASEVDLTKYNAHGRMLGSLRAALRRMAEAYVLRGLILDELDRGRPVLVLGDMNDGEHAVSTEIITGETPFKNYSWMRRHDAQRANDRYSRQEAEQIREDIERVRLHSAEKMFVRRSARDMVYTAAFGGNFESIDQIFMSRHFHPEYADRVGEMEYFSVLNDHLTDGSHPEAPYNKLASDHGQIMAHMRLRDVEE